MLAEIKCDKFFDNDVVRPPIIFHDGFNVVLGDENATNSIGKSTFLLIVDFVFGGDDYPEKATDVIENVGEHKIQFAFKFNGKVFYFSRSTKNFRIVKQYDEKYTEETDWSIDDFRKWLAFQYKITQHDLSFRGAVSKFFRVYLKENLDEKHPLHGYKQESESNIIVGLEKLFNQYESICDAKTTLDTAKKTKKAYEAAEEVKIIPCVSNKTEYQKKREELIQIQAEQEQYSDAEYLKNRTATEVSTITKLREDLQYFRCSKTRLETKRTRLKNQLTSQMPIFINDLSELQNFFPSADLMEIEKIESFHRKLTDILQTELRTELVSTESELSNIMHQIADVEADLATYDIPTNISKKMLYEYSKREQQIEKIQQQLNNFDQLKKLKEDIKEYQKKYDAQSINVLSRIEIAVNSKMKDLDNFIYHGNKQPPELRLTSKGYTFKTPSDTGTGTSYKSLIVLDLSVISLTNLPALIHDSPILKNIGDAPIEKIIDLYTQIYGKQIFIALDKSLSYGHNVAEALDRSAVIKLSDDKSALFGRCWSKKTKNDLEHS